MPPGPRRRRRGRTCCSSPSAPATSSRPTSTASTTFPPTPATTAPAAGGNYDFQANTYNASGRLRLTYGDSEKGLARAQPRLGYEVKYVDIRTDDPRLPDALLDASAGVGLGILAYNGYIGAVSLGAGYATADDRSDANALYFQGDFAVGKTFANGDSFGVVLDYDGNRTFLPDWPLPGFQYRRRLDPRRATAPAADPSGDDAATRPRGPRGPRSGVDEYDPKLDPARLTLAIGVPTAGIEWRPTDRFRLNLNYLLPLNFDFRADYQIVGDEQSGAGVYASLSRSVSAFKWNSFGDNDDRIFFRQVRLEGGVNYRLNDRLEVILSGGYVFDQEFTYGFDTRDTNTLADVDDTPYVRGQLQLRL